jgi:hypothetical protein
MAVEEELERFVEEGKGGEEDKGPGGESEGAGENTGPAEDVMKRLEHAKVGQKMLRALNVILKSTSVGCGRSLVLELGVV